MSSSCYEGLRTSSNFVSKPVIFSIGGFFPDAGDSASPFFKKRAGA
jgi:hypothetical protein